MALSPQIIDSIKQSAAIEEVISDFVSLKKKGHYYTACCPFHDEKTPSFTVTPAKGIYKCFGCGKAGDSIQFVMDLEGLSYPEALRYLANKYGIEINEIESPEAQAKNTERESLLIVLSFASQYYENLLWESEDGKSIGLSYFKERGYSHDTVKKFNLGYSLEEWDGLTKAALEAGYSKEFLLKAGLSLEGKDKKSDSLYDRFRGRVIFPIHNLTGKVIAFGARTLKKDKKQPKYLNSPETEVYHKSKVLYGLFQAKQAIRHEDNCFLVEGYTDVISLHQEGVSNVVSSSGTSLTEDQIKLIHRYSENITVLYDGDAAGQKASIRGIDLILAQGMNVKVVTFPEGEDPDSFVQKNGGENFQKYILENSKDFIAYKTEVSLKEAGNDPVKKATVIRDIVESISKIPDSIKRAVFFQQCSQMLNIQEDVLITEFNKIQLKDRKPKADFAPDFPAPEINLEVKQEPRQKDLQVSAVEMQEKEITRLLLKYGNEQVDTSNFVSYVLSEIDDIEFTVPIYKKIIELIKEDFQELGVIREQKFISHPDEEIRSEAISLITSKYALSDKWTKYEIFVPKDEELLSSLGYLTILRLKFRSLKFMIKENMREIQKAENAKEDIVPLLHVHKQLKEAEKELAGLLGIVIS